MTASDVARALSGVFDPELGIDVVSLGLVYGIDLDGDGIAVWMTTTTPSCPMSEALRGMAEAVLHQLAGETQTVRVELVYEPPWNVHMATRQALRHLGLVA